MRRTCDWWEHDGPNDRTVCAEEGRYVILPGGDHRPGLVFCNHHFMQLPGQVHARLVQAASGPRCDFCSSDSPTWILRTRGTTMNDMMAVREDDTVEATYVSNLGETWAVCDACKPLIESVLQGQSENAIDALYDAVVARNPLFNDPELRTVVLELWGTVFADAVWPLTREATT